jgi:hypothetical protein
MADTVTISTEEYQKLKDQLASLTKSVGQTTPRIDGYSIALNKAGSVLSNFGSGMGDLAKAAITGNEKLTAYTSAIGKAGKDIPGFQKLIAGGGGAIAQFIDDTGGAFKELANTGIRGANGLSDVAKYAAAAGIQTDKLAGFIRNNEQAFRTMGSTGANAAENFSRMSLSFRSDTKNYSQGLRQLGYGTEEINEALVGFAAINRTQYLENLKTGQSQNKAAFKFATELDRMSQITGENRKQLMKDMDAKRRDGRVQAFLRTQTGEMGDAILQTSTMLGKMDKGAQALVEDIMIQGSATKESAAAAAFYGQDVIDAAQRMREAQKAGDTKAYAKAQEDLIAGMTAAQNDQSKINAAQYRVSGGFISSMQDSIGAFTEFNDRVKAKAAELGLDVNNAQDLAKASRALMQDIVKAQGSAGVKDGKVEVAQDKMTATYAAATDAISLTSSALKTELVEGAREAANSLGKDLPQGINNATGKMIDVLTKNAGQIREAMYSDSANTVSGTDISKVPGADVNAVQGATSQAGLAMERGSDLTNQLIVTLEELNRTLGKLSTSINPKGNFMGGTAFGDMLNMVGEQGPEFITPNANSLVVTAKQMADKMRPQMESMAAQMQPQMESMAENMKANAPKIASAMNRSSKEIDFEQLFAGQNQQVAQTNKLLEQVVRYIKKNGSDLQRI